MTEVVTHGVVVNAFVYVVVTTVELIVAIINSPVKTRAAPIHCLFERAFPKMMTDPSTVKNFLVVVTREQGRGPNSETHMKMKYWPSAEAAETLASCQMIEG